LDLCGLLFSSLLHQPLQGGSDQVALLETNNVVEVLYDAQLIY
jgi:hypothetical protein